MVASGRKRDGTRRLRAACFSLAMAVTQIGPAMAQGNDVCGPDVSAGTFKVSEIGPRIAGIYEGQAPGMGYTTGIQTFKVQISFSNGRLYIGDGATIFELRPVHGTRKELRYDPIKQMPLPEAARVSKIALEDMELVTDCDSRIAPQFMWTNGTGARASSGLYSFLDRDTALGMMWNSAMGAREVVLLRKPGN
jgi:hypothetical protein